MLYNSSSIRTYLIILIFVTLFTGICPLFGQSNHIPLRGKSFLGALELMPNGKLAQGSYRVKSPFPGELDPMLDPYKWYGEGDEQVCGMVGDAVLYLEWWIKGSEPLERYKFDWTSSGYFDVKYVNDKGEKVQKRINWYDLSKYPNLKKRFDMINPFNIGFEFTFHSGDKSDKDYYDFRKRYKIMEDLGSAGYAVDYTRKLQSWKVVHVRGREKKDWGNPAILVGGWKEFCPLAEKHKDKESRLLELFRMGRTLVMSSYKITEMKWRVSDFVYIAKKFEAYESGKEKPGALDEVADGEKENKAGDESWDGTDLIDSETEAFRGENGKMGIRTKKGRTLKEPDYDNIVQSAIQKYYLATRGNTLYLLNNMGSIVLTKNCSAVPSVGACPGGDLWASVITSNTQIGDYDYYMNKGEKYFFGSGVQTRSLKWFNSYAPFKMGSLIVSSTYNSPEEREQAEREAEERKRQADIRREEMYRQVREQGSSLESQGYIRSEKAECQ